MQLAVRLNLLRLRLKTDAFHHLDIRADPDVPNDPDVVVFGRGVVAC